MKKIILLTLIISPALNAQTKSIFTDLREGIHLEFEDMNYTWKGDSLKITYINLFNYKIEATKTFRSESREGVIKKVNDWMKQNTYAYKPYRLYEDSNSRNFKFIAVVSYGRLIRRAK